MDAIRDDEFLANIDAANLPVEADANAAKVNVASRVTVVTVTEVEKPSQALDALVVDAHAKVVSSLDV